MVGDSVHVPGHQLPVVLPYPAGGCVFVGKGGGCHGPYVRSAIVWMRIFTGRCQSSNPVFTPTCYRPFENAHVGY